MLDDVVQAKADAVASVQVKSLRT